MARTFTVLQLVNRGRQRSDQANSDELSATEWKENLSTVYAELYAEVADSGMRYFESEETVTGNGSATYALPSDHLSTIGVDYLSGGKRYPLMELMAQERNLYTGSTDSNARAYALVGSNLLLDPAPASGTYYHIYVPQPADLSAEADGTSVDVITPDGEAFITWGLSVLAKHKVDDDVRTDREEREAARSRVREWAQKRSFNTPRRSMNDDDLYRRDPGDWFPW